MKRKYIEKTEKWVNRLVYICAEEDELLRRVKRAWFWQKEPIHTELLEIAREKRKLELKIVQMMRRHQGREARETNGEFLWHLLGPLSDNDVGDLLMDYTSDGMHWTMLCRKIREQHDMVMGYET